MKSVNGASAPWVEFDFFRITLEDIKGEEQMKYRYHHLHLICSDLEEMIHFFSETLGAELVARRKFGPSDGASLNLSGVLINLRVAREDEDAVHGDSKTRFGYHHIGLQVDDLDAVYGELKEKGFPFSLPPTDAGDVKMAFFEGPDHLVFEIFQVLN